jgi:hypothetical protein
MGILGFYIATGSKLTAINWIMLGLADLTSFNAKRIPVSVRNLTVYISTRTVLYTTKYITQSPEIITNNRNTRRLLPGCEAAGT